MFAIVHQRSWNELAQMADVADTATAHLYLGPDGKPLPPDPERTCDTTSPCVQRNLTILLAFDNGFQHAPKQASDKAAAIWYAGLERLTHWSLLTHCSYAIPLMVYSFLGLEAITVTTGEARAPRDTRWPARTLVWIIFALYLFVVVGEAVNVSWLNPSLPTFGTWDRAINAPWWTIAKGGSQSPIVLAAIATEHDRLATFVQVACIFSVLSAANTSLYIASRTLYALGIEINESFSPFRYIRKLVTWVWPATGAPIGALILSAAAFIWIPYLHFTHVQDVSIDSLVVKTLQRHN